MRHDLPAAVLTVDDDATPVLQLQMLRQFDRNHMQMPDEFAIRSRDAGMRRNDFDEHMGRHLRLDVADR